MSVHASNARRNITSDVHHTTYSWACGNLTVLIRWFNPFTMLCSNPGCVVLGFSRCVRPVSPSCPPCGHTIFGEGKKDRRKLRRVHSVVARKAHMKCAITDHMILMSCRCLVPTSLQQKRQPSLPQHPSESPQHRRAHRATVRRRRA